METISFDFDRLNDKERSKLLKGSVIPRPIAWITTLNENGSINLAPFSFFTMLNTSLLCVSIQRENGRHKDTARNILREGEAVVHIVGRDWVEAVDFTSKPVAAEESELAQLGLATVPSRKIRTPGIAAAEIRLETTLWKQMDLSNYEDDEAESDLLILRARFAHIADDLYDRKNNYILHEVLDPLSRLGGPYYASIEELPGFKRSF